MINVILIRLEKSSPYGPFYGVKPSPKSKCKMPHVRPIALNTRECAGKPP